MNSPHHPRRKDKEILTRTELDRVLHGGEVCRLAMAVDGEPYLVPVSFGYDGSRLYFHTAREGRKLDFLKVNPRVCFEVEQGVQLVRHPELACSWSFDFASVIGYGRVCELLQPAERRMALDSIMHHYGGDGSWDYSPTSLAHARVWAIKIETMTGKQAQGKANR